MTNQAPYLVSSIPPTVDFQTAGFLLRSAIDIADSCAELAERREALLKLIAGLVDADSGHWAWIRGRPDSEIVMPVGFIPYGYTNDQLTAVQQFSMDPRLQKEFHGRLVKHMRSNYRPDAVWSVISRDALADVIVDPNHWISQYMQRIGVAHWMQGGKYIGGNALSVMVLGRRPGKAEFGDAEQSIMDFVFTNIPWLWANPEERVSQSSVESLTPRQRAVTFLLLDGYSRKEIAARLGISQDTVGDHLKAIFAHFEVNSATELAALFLRSK